jgi:hypothetical protein
MGVYLEMDSQAAFAGGRASFLGRLAGRANGRRQLYESAFFSRMLHGTTERARRQAAANQGPQSH